MKNKIPGIKIINPGLASSFQDQGRRGYLHLGIPQSGVMDIESQYIANALVSKKSESSVLEMVGMGIQFEVETEMVIAITGARLEIYVNDIKVPMYESIFLRSGDRVSLGPITEGFRTYMAISHEMVLDNAFESESTDSMSRFGGYKGRCLKANDLVYLYKKDLPPLYKYYKKVTNQAIHVMFTYEKDDFKKEVLLAQAFEVTPEISRMGMRLKGPSLKAQGGHDIISSPVCPGTIQVPASGQPIILLQDGQTTGGYKRLGCVAFPDLSRLSQMKPGDFINFKEISIKEGQIYKKKWQEDLNQIKSSLKPIKAYTVRIHQSTYYVSLEERE